MYRYAMLVALLLVVVPLAVVVSDEVPNDAPSSCLLMNGVSWLAIESLPEGLREQLTDQTPTQVMNGVTFVPIKQFVEAHGGSVGWDGAAGVVTVECDEQVIPFKALHSETFWQTRQAKPSAVLVSLAPVYTGSRPCYLDDIGIYWVTPELLPEALEQEVTEKTPGTTYEGVFIVSLKHFAEDHGAQFHEDERSVSVTFEGDTTCYVPLDLNTFLWQVGKRPEYRPPPRKPRRNDRQIFYELVSLEDRMDMEAAREYICNKYQITRSQLLQIMIRGGGENWPMPPYAGP